MATISQSYDLNLIPGGVPVRVPVSQYDSSSRDIIFTLYNGDVLFSIPSGSVITCDGTKPDGKGFSYTASFSGSNVTVTVTKQMTAVHGAVICQLTVTKSGQVLGSANFVLDVERAALGDGTDMSASEIATLTQLLEEATQKAIDASTSASAAAKSASAAAKSATETADKAPNNHASAATTYGLATTSLYGHAKLVNNLTTSAYADGQALSAYQGKVLKDSIDTLNSNLLPGETTRYSGVANSYDAGNILRFDGKMITPGNYPSNAFAVLLSSSPTMNRSALYVITTSTDNAAVSLIGESNEGTMIIRFTSPSMAAFLQTTSETGYVIYATVVKLR